MTLSPEIIASVRALLAQSNRPTNAEIARRCGCSSRKVSEIAGGAGPMGGASSRMLADLELNAAGVSNAAIADQTGRTRQAVGAMLKRARVLGFPVKNNRG